ncbi:MAG: carboxypeptidase regulatory-like domain-containing protein [Gemmatimonadaceae bacterium]
MCAFGRFSARLWVPLLLSGIVTPVPRAIAQPSGTVSGIVLDVSDNPVSGARVSLGGTQLATVSDERGAFRITGVTLGPVEILARRLGFAPVAQKATVTSQEASGRIQFRMSALPNTMSPVVVQASRVKYTGRLAGYYERLRRRSGGYFIARDEIDRKSYRTLSQLLAQTPGVNAMRSPTGLGAVRMRGRACRPLVWLDGTAMPAGEVDLDAFSASTLHGIEMYLGSTNAPIDYTGPQGMSSCGTILLWSRGRDTEPRRSATRSDVDLEKLVSALSVYTPDQVDRPAALAGSPPLVVAHPPALFASGTGGNVVAEFVVDSVGRIENGTLAIVSSAHPLFSEAVIQGLERAVYAPALKNGKPVRQVVYQSFSFPAAPGKSGKNGGS